MNSDYEDDIMGEIRAFRDAFAAAHNYDIRAMLATLREKTAASGLPTMSFPPRPAEPIFLARKPSEKTEPLPADRVA